MTTNTTQNETGYALNREQREILHHTRHRAPGGHYCGGGKEMDALVAMGLMESHGTFLGNPYFGITAEGVKALHTMKKKPHSPQAKPGSSGENPEPGVTGAGREETSQVPGTTAAPPGHGGTESQAAFGPVGDVGVGTPGGDVGPVGTPGLPGPDYVPCQADVNPLQGPAGRQAIDAALGRLEMRMAEQGRLIAELAALLARAVQAVRGIAGAPPDAGLAALMSGADEYLRTTKD